MDLTVLLALCYPYCFSKLILEIGQPTNYQKLVVESLHLWRTCSSGRILLVLLSSICWISVQNRLEFNLERWWRHDFSNCALTLGKEMVEGKLIWKPNELWIRSYYMLISTDHAYSNVLGLLRWPALSFPQWSQYISSCTVSSWKLFFFIHSKWHVPEDIENSDESTGNHYLLIVILILLILFLPYVSIII